MNKAARSVTKELVPVSLVELVLDALALDVEAEVVPDDVVVSVVPVVAPVVDDVSDVPLNRLDSFSRSASSCLISASKLVAVLDAVSVVLPVVADDVVLVDVPVDVEETSEGGGGGGG